MWLAKSVYRTTLIPVLVFLLVSHTAIYTWLSNEYELQLDSSQQQLRELNQRALNGALSNSYHKLLDIAQTLSLVSTAQGQDISAVSAVMDASFQQFEFQGLLDSAALFDKTLNLTESWGAAEARYPVMVNRAFENERPVSQLHCSKTCSRYLAIPLLSGGQVHSVLVIGLNIQDMILAYKTSTGTDIGVAPPTGEQGDGELNSEQLDFPILTQRSQNSQVIKLLLSREPQVELNQPYQIEAFGRINEVVFSKLDPSDVLGALWVTISDMTTSQLRLAQRKDQLLWALVISFTAVSLLAAMLVGRLAARLASFRDFLYLSARLDTEPSYDAAKAGELEGLYSASLGVFGQLKKYLIDERKVSEQYDQMASALRLERHVVDGLLNSSASIIVTHGPGGRVHSVNDLGSRMLEQQGLSLSSGLSFFDLFHVCDDPDGIVDSVNQLYLGQANLIRSQSQFIDSDGRLCHMSWIHSYMDGWSDQGAVVLSMGVDITDQKRSEERLSWLEYHDPLAASENRQKLLDALPEMLKDCEKHEHLLALLYCEVRDPFGKRLILGIREHDDLVGAVVERISASLRGNDVLARITENQFVVLMKGFQNASQVERVCEKVMMSFSVPFYVNGEEQVASISVGISIWPNHGGDVANLLDCAEDALHLAQREGTNQYRFYR
ncbi:diguanylate cyclase domain-containing protein [Neptunomonas marina]|uniref:Diguanylate cyclase n=1 Tax=Neptunomonas marina TaxID=1815562 RepID=A0A437QC41_9GAMM|nr:diguanylate cyclase [Neptunomonas marina]RVU32128.1 diguanylate cyclase [Neptunomonas marina]